MNNNLFKVIFNKRLGKMDVVSEITTVDGKTASESTGHSVFFEHLLKPIVWALLVSTGNLAFMQSAMAQVVADKSAPSNQQAVILNTASGATQANISTPTAGGVSMNQYSQFNVNNPLILNNSRISVTTQTAGYVQGNPYMAAGSARVIVNQVNGSVANLNNSIEIAGPRSELVIAAPNGIVVNGSTIINASRTTLTTGTPIINGGNLEAYRVTQGQVSVDGTGLDTSQSDYTNIIAQSVKANAGIWAKDLTVTTGANQVNVDGSHSAITGIAPAPAYALDSSALGGMYAGKITFISTDTGVGINNAGQIAASAGQVNIDANGLLTNSGTISSNGQANATTVKATAIHNSGTISAQGNTQIQTQNETNNSGTITSGVELKVSASDIDNSKGTLNGQRIELNANSLNNTKGTIAQTGSQALALNAGNINNANGGLIGYAPLDTSGGTGGTGTGGTTIPTPTPAPPSTAGGGGTSTVVQPIPVVLADGVINIKNIINNDAGQVTANGGIDLTSNQGLTNHGTLSLNKLNVTGDALDNSSGTITTSQLTAHTNTINNTSGKLGSTGNIDLSANSLTNSSGQITASGTTTANIAGVVLNDNGTLASNDSLTLNAAGIDNTKGTIASVKSNANVTSSGALTNAAGQIQASTDLTVNSQATDNTDGQIIATTVNVNSHGKSFNNTRGIISSDTTTVNTGALNNDAGLIQGVKKATVNTNGQTLTNTRSGTTKGIISGGSLSVSSGALDNTTGQIQATTTLGIASQALNNTDGHINAATTTINTQNAAFTNTHGQIVGDTTTVDSGALTNDAGLIQGTQSLAINTHGQTLNNSNSGTAGGITSGGVLTIQSGDLSNTSGYIGAVGATQITAGQITNAGQIVTQAKTNITGTGLDNRGGQIVTQAKTNITGTGLDNRGGQIVVAGNANINLGSGTLNNDASFIHGDSTVTVNADQVINTNTNNSDKGIEGSSVILNVNTVDNIAGAIRADQDLNIIGSGTVTNSNGIITSTNNVTIKDNAATKGQAIINGNGSITAGVSTNIDSKSLTGDGKVSSNKDMSIRLVDDFTNNAVLQATNNLSLTSAGQITNNSQILAGGTNSVAAQNVTNAANAEISGNSSEVIASGTVTNRGLIDGNNTLVQGTTVNNIGTGRMYGGHLSIAANTLNNVDETISGVNKAATIAARDRLDIGATTINNQEHASLFSAGDMAIGGALDASHNATGQATTLNNLSATIESLDNMSLNVGQINNRNMHFATAVQAVGSEHVVQVQGTSTSDPISFQSGPLPAGPSAIYTVDSNQVAGIPNLSQDWRSGTKYTLDLANNIYLINDESNYLAVPEGYYGGWQKTDFTRTTNETVATQSDPSKIVAGGDLTLSTNSLLNDNSKIIVGGTLQGDAGHIANTQTIGSSTVVDSGTRNSYSRGGRGGRDGTDISSAVYNVTHPSQTITLDTSSVEQHTNGSSGTSINGHTATGAGSATSGSGSATASVTANPNSIATVASIDAKYPTLIKTGDVNTSLPNSSLLSVNPNSSGYLVETDPKFASYKNWLSSDYMLGALNLDPLAMHKRLGDGFYEQKLIREQIAQLTGRRYLAGQSNDDDQYKALMTSGVTFAGQYKLRPGIALTADQMAHLTSDIVWLVEEQVTLPDGTKTTALVPKVYVAVRPGDIDGSGSLISANNIDLKLTGDLNNSGTISGRQVTQISAKNINNLAGRLNGNQINLQARNDINNIGGIIDAKTSANINAGHDVNVVSTTSTAKNTYGTETIVDRVAGIYVGDGTKQANNTLTVHAGNNVNLTGAKVSNDGIGGTVIQGGNDLNLNTVKTSSEVTFYRDARNGYSTKDSTEMSTSINGQGNIKLDAGHDLNARAANVNSDAGNVVATAKHDVNIGVGETTSSSVTDNYTKKSGLLGSKKTTTHTTSESSTSIASNFTGDKVLIGAGHDANITGSNIVSDTQTWIDAKNDLNINAATNTSDSTRFQETKKSGLSGTGGLGFTLGKSQNSLDGTQSATTHTGSMVASNHGDVRLTAGKTLTVSGSDVQAANDITAVANNIHITNVTDTNTQTSEQRSKSVGLTVALSGTIGDAANSVASTLQQSSTAKERGNKRLAAAYDTKAVLSVVQAGQSVYQDATDVSEAKKATQGPFVGISASLGASRSQSNSVSTQTTAKGSNLAAGNHLTLLATGDGSIGADGFANDGNVTVTGSSLSAKNVDVTAARDISFNSAANTSSDASTNKSAGGAIGVSVGVSTSNKMGIQVFANANASRGNGNGSSLTHTETTVTATDKLNLNAGRDLSLTGAQARGNSVTANVGRDLTITSEQDSNTYNSKQTSANVGIAVPIGVGSVSGSVGVNQQKLNSNYNSVAEQSGLYAGNGGSNVNVAGHTQLNGGAIASTAPAELNNLSTGSLGVADIDNQAQYRASSSGINLGTGSVLSNAVKNMTSALPSSGNQTGNESSTTHAAISAGNITIGGHAATDAELAGVSRDTSNAANSLKPIFSLQKVQDDMAMGQVVGEIGQLATQITVTAMQRDAYVKLDHALAANEAHPITPPTQAEALANNPVGNALYQAATTDIERTAVLDQMRRDGAFGNLAQAQQNYTDAQNRYGVGSAFNAAAQGLTGLASGVAGGNVAQGLSAALQPLLARGIGLYFDGLQVNGKDTPENTVGRALAHAAAGAAVAYASGNNAGVGAIGAVSGEAMAAIVKEKYYPGKSNDQLTQAEKEDIRAISTLASGLVGAAAGGSFENAATAANAGYNSAVNNQEAIGWNADGSPIDYSEGFNHKNGFKSLMTQTQAVGALAAAGVTVAAPEVWAYCMTTGYALCTRLTIIASGAAGVDTPIGRATAQEVSALSNAASAAFKGTSQTVAGRAITKHPEYFGYNTTEELMSVFRTPDARNNLANETINNILNNGVKTTGAGGRYPNGWITFTIPNGIAASWTAAGEFIGFRGMK